MHSIEALLDTETDAAVRAEWQALADARLPSQARHGGATNAPHVTLVAAPSIDASHDDGLARAADLLPLPLRFGGLLVFGAPPRGLVLVRSVVVTDRILRLHAAVHDELGGSVGVENTRPGNWSPHVTLAARLTPAQVAGALGVLGGSPHADGSQLASLRRWDSDAATVTPLTASRAR